MIAASATHLVLIPSYNPGSKVYETVRTARQHWNPVWVVVDGSNDGSAEGLQQMAAQDVGLRVFILPHNQGKGRAVLHGLELAAAAGFTHLLTMDSDGQHPPESIPQFMAESIAQPAAMILGRPIFEASAPSLRVNGRRVYPVEPLRQIMHAQLWMRQFDFDPEAVVRLCWRGIRPVNLPAPVRYYTKEQGGVSHFRYLRDNALLTWMHTRLFIGFVLRIPLLITRRVTGWF